MLRNLYEAVPHDPARELFRVPDVMRQMLERGWLGEKRGQGFYKRVGKGAEKEIWALDRKTLEYHPANKVKFFSVEVVRGMEDLGERLRALVSGDDRAARFLWPLFRDFLIYSAQMVPEISDRVVEIDRAMRWGYAFAKGPFEYWDLLGVPETVERMRREGVAVPENVERMLASGARSLLRSGRSRSRAAHPLLRSERRRLRGTRAAARRRRTGRDQTRARRGAAERRRVAWWTWATACCAWSSTAR